MRGSLLRLWLVVAGLWAGAVAGSLGRAGFRAGVYCVVAAGSLAVLRRAPLATLVALGLLGAGCGVVAGAARAADGAGLESLATDVPACVVEGRVLETMGGLGRLVSVEEASCGGRDAAVVAGAAVSDIDAPAGARFSARGWLMPLGDDGYDQARRRAGARAELHVDDVVVVPPRGAFALAERVRKGLVAATESVSTAEGGLLRGVTIGDTDGISALTLEEFRRSGLSHLLAVSGSNVAIVLVGVAWAARRLSLYARIAVCASALALFVLVVGPDGSVLRAAAMGAVALVALAAGRQAEPLHALGVALAVLLAARPSSAFSLGLHLSVGATAGIILWAGRLNHWMRRVPSFVSIPLSVTMAAQLGVLPLLVISFGEASVIAPVANVAAAPAVAPATVLGFVGGLVAIAHEGLGGHVLRLAEPFASWMLFVGDVAARPAWAAVAVPRAVGWLGAAAVCVAVIRTLRTYGAPITLDR